MAPKKITSKSTATKKELGKRDLKKIQGGSAATSTAVSGLPTGKRMHKPY
jgi:hypothetical protein